jgi:ABC-type phosphate transport system substrate-binding protein
MRRSLCVLVFALFAAVVVAPVFAQDNPFLGTWKLNVAKSKFEGAPAPKSLTRTITAEGSGAKYSFEGVSADGNSYAYSFVTNYDGKEVPVTGKGTPGGADSIALKRVNAHKVEGTLKKGGKEVGKVTAEVSKDGKVATVKMKGKSADGKDLSTDTVYDKQ